MQLTLPGLKNQISSALRANIIKVSQSDLYHGSPGLLFRLLNLQQFIGLMPIIRLQLKDIEDSPPPSPGLTCTPLHAKLHSDRHLNLFTILNRCNLFLRYSIICKITRLFFCFGMTSGCTIRQTHEQLLAQTQPHNPCKILEL